MFNPKTMRYLILLLFTPILCFSQITLQEILAIDSETTFKRTMIENGFSKEDDENLKRISYRKDLTANVTNMYASFRASDSIFNGGAIFMFIPDSFQKNVTYDRIYDLVKKECGFSEIRDDVGNGDFAYYKCPDIDPDPRLVELQDLIHKNIKTADKSISLTDIEIGFSKKDNIYLINLPISDFNSEKKIEILTPAYKMMLEKQKE